MKKKTTVIIGVITFALAILVVSIIGFSIKRNGDCFSAVLTFGCDVQNYEQKSDEIYLTFEHEFIGKKFVKSIAIGENQTEKISPENIKDIIGITVEMNIPKEKIQVYDLDFQDKNLANLAWFLFEDGMFDDYCEIVNVSFK